LKSRINEEGFRLAKTAHCVRQDCFETGIARVVAMASWQFQSELNSDRTLNVPADIADSLSTGQKLLVVLATTDQTEQVDWQRLTLEQFFEGYGPGDAIYDELPAG
jgi:hypothetical protein